MAGSTAFGTTVMKVAVPIANLTNVSGPSIVGDTIDLSSHDSADTFREFCAGMRDGGEIGLEYNLDLSDAGQVALYTDVCDGSIDAYTITWTNGIGAPVATFNAIVTAFNIDAPYEDKLSGSSTLKITGKPTITP